MSKTTVERLRDRLEQSRQELAQLERDIPAAVADGADELTISKMRSRRRELADQLEDTSEAVRFLEDRRSQEAKTAADEALNKARIAAKSQADKFLGAASEVDQALATLEQAFNRLALASIDFSRSLRLAGLSDQGRIGTTTKQTVRWASWQSAPAFSEQAEIPRAQVHRRATLRDSLARVIPAIPVTKGN